jgi:uncharacterized surface protein with fasciclin (FAS1) repeats
VTELKFNVDIATLVTEAADLSTFLKAAIAADLVETLKGQSPLAIFAPDNESFSKVPAGYTRQLTQQQGTADWRSYVPRGGREALGG